MGHPGIEAAVRKIQRIEADEVQRFRRKIGTKGKRILLFLTEPICQDFGLAPEDREFIGYTEYSILEYFLDHFSDSDAKLLIKPHPRQDVEDLSRFLAERFEARKIDHDQAGQIA